LPPDELHHFSEGLIHTINQIGLMVSNIGPYVFFGVQMNVSIIPGWLDDDDDVGLDGSVGRTSG
jgi:hypothetical protein